MKKYFAIALLIALVLTLTACGGSNKTEPAPAPAKAVSLADVAAGFGLGEEMMNLTESDMLDMYGIEKADMKQFFGAVNSSGIKADEIVLVEATSADAAGRVKEALEKRLNNKRAETENYLPDEFAVIKECSVNVSGNFVSMIVAPNAADLVKTYNAAIG